MGGVAAHLDIGISQDNVRKRHEEEEPQAGGQVVGERGQGWRQEWVGRDSVGERVGQGENCLLRTPGFMEMRGVIGRASKALTHAQAGSVLVGP